MTYEEFLTRFDEDVHAEWVDGEVTVFMPPKTIHQRIMTFLANLLGSYAQIFNLGEVLTAPFEMRLFPGRSSREPDLLFVAHEHRDRLTEDRLEGPADLAIEIVSTSSTRRDRVEKFREYREAGVREYWIADPRPRQRRFYCYRLDERGEYEPIAPDAAGRHHSTVLPGFWLDPAWLWQEPPPSTLTILATIAPEALRAALPATVASRDAAPDGAAGARAGERRG
jgi:Uma2 family endonuclease